MPSTRLTQRRVDTLKPRKQTYDVRDPGLKGFGVRIMPSGSKRYFLHSQSGGKRIWHAIGDAGAITLDSARSRARALLAAKQDGNADNPDTRDPIPFETVADEVFQRYGRRWKPRTLAVNLSYYRNQILPWFQGKPVSDITRRDVLQWHASLHGVPFAADRSAPILSVILKQAEAYGYRPEGSNPCTGIKRYRRGGRERFLSAREMRRLSKVLDRYQDRHPVEASIVRLLLLTGCRKSEILTLRWSEYREGRLYLSDSKTGRARSGCRLPHARFSMACPEPVPGCFRRHGAMVPIRDTGSIASGGRFGPRPSSTMCAVTISATAMPRLPLPTVRRFSRSANCLATTTRRRH